MIEFLETGDITEHPSYEALVVAFWYAKNQDRVEDALAMEEGITDYARKKTGLGELVINLAFWNAADY